MNARGPILVTGVAGFVGRAVTQLLLTRGEAVIGVDDHSDRSDLALQAARLATLAPFPDFTLIEGDIAAPGLIAGLLQTHGIRRVVHLAARTGVRQSLSAPLAYEHSNVAGHLAVLEACASTPALEHLVYASSSSVYGERSIESGGFHESDPADRPASLYAATKRAAELLSASYAHLHGFPQTGLRLFTVYGPWGRPDMSYFRFTRALCSGTPIEIFGAGSMTRDFGYIDDAAAGIIAVLDRPPARGENRILNLGSGHPTRLSAMIEALEDIVGRTAEKTLRPRQAGDVTATRADISALQALTGQRPRTMLTEGLQQFVAWYRDFYPKA